MFPCTIQSMDSYVIDGGYPLEGQVRISGNKNGALALLAASLLSEEKVFLENAPSIADVDVMIELMRHMGAAVSKVEEGRVSIDPVGLSLEYPEVPVHLVDAIRASLLLLGPVLGRKGKIVLPPPGGDVIGFRRIDTQIAAIEAMGGVCRISDDGFLEADGSGIHCADVFLDEASVITTENMIMISVLTEGVTTITNAACEPHVQDLCRLLISMGALIDGVGSNLLRITGVKRLSATRFTVGPDYMEVGSFIGLAAASGSELELLNLNSGDLRMIESGFHRIGITWETISDSSILVPKSQPKEMKKSMSGYTLKIDDAPWPGFPADLLSIITVAATQMSGSILIHEKMYESRMFFIDWLIRMGADIILCDPHRALVHGPVRLKPAVVSSPDVRAGMALIIATLCAEGTSIVQNIYQIERGYEDLPGKLRGIGAHIRKDN